MEERCDEKGYEDGRPEEGRPEHPHDRVARREKPRGISLERREELQRIAVSIAHLLRSQTSRPERCVVRSMVETLLEDER